MHRILTKMLAMPRVGNGGHATAVVKSHYPKNLIFISRQDSVAGVHTCLPRMTIEPRAPLRLAQRSSRWAIPGAISLRHTGSERCSPLERRQHAFAATGSSEYVRAYSATTKRMEPKRLLKAIFTWEMTTPTSSSIFGGWGTEDRGRALAYENRPQLNSP